MGRLSSRAATTSRSGLTKRGQEAKLRCQTEHLTRVEARAQPRAIARMFPRVRLLAVHEGAAHSWIRLFSGLGETFLPRHKTPLQRSSLVRRTRASRWGLASGLQWRLPSRTRHFPAATR